MVNINDMDGPEQVPENVLQAIFEKQWKLAEKYKDIEGMEDLLSEKRLKTNLDTQFGQIWLKDFCWRVTEELAESIEPVYMHEELTDEMRQHYIEELADALHFFVELCIIAGYSENDFKNIEDITTEVITEIENENADQLAANHWSVVYYLGLFANCLKQKKWKQTHQLTDRKKAFSNLNKAYEALIMAMKFAGCTDEDIYSFYFKKNAVNQFRQRSNY